MNDIPVSVLESLSQGGHCQISPSPNGVMYYGQVAAVGLGPSPTGALKLTVYWAWLRESLATSGEAHNWELHTEPPATDFDLGDYKPVVCSGSFQLLPRGGTPTSERPAVTFYLPDFEPAFHPVAIPASTGPLDLLIVVPQLGH